MPVRVAALMSLPLTRHPPPLNALCTYNLVADTTPSLDSRIELHLYDRPSFVFVPPAPRHRKERVQLLFQRHFGFDFNDTKNH